VDLEVASLLCTGAIAHYDVHTHGPPITICPIKVVSSSSSGKKRMGWDGRYPNSFLQTRRVRYETFDGLRWILDPQSSDSALSVPPVHNQPASTILKADMSAGYHHEMEEIQKSKRRVMRGPLHMSLLGFLDDSGIALPDQPIIPIPELLMRARSALPNVMSTGRPDLWPADAVAVLLFVQCPLPEDRGRPEPDDHRSDPGLVSGPVHLDVELMGAAYLPGPLKVFGDALSRVQDAENDWALYPHVWELVFRWMKDAHLPWPTAEGFASELNHRLPRYCSRFLEPGATWTNFFSQHWRGEVVWINPPFCLMLRTLLHIRRHNVAGYWVLPEWTEHQWWHEVQRLKKVEFLLPPNAFTSVLTAHTTGFRDPGYRIWVIGLGPEV